MTQSAWVDDLDQAIGGRFDEIVALRRHMHAHPEASGKEHETTLHLYRLLDSEGIEAQMGPGGRGLIVDLCNDNNRPRIAVRADLDALHIHDLKQVSYRSQSDGVMHACGHDGHTAVVTGALLGLSDMVRGPGLPIPINLRFVFQPAEETCRGAREMIEVGALDRVEAIFACHMDPTRKVGKIGIRQGVLTAHCDAMRFIVKGRGGHAARPHETIDPIAAAAQLISSIYLFVPRATDSQEAVVATIGQIIGGDNPNVIPETVELLGTLRTLDEDVRQKTIEHLRQLARGLAETSGTRIDVHFDQSVASVCNDARLTDIIKDAAIEVIGRKNIDQIPRASMGSEDFAVYLEHIPGTMFRLGCASEAVGDAPLHSPTFDIDERALGIGARVLARSVIMWSESSNA